jgi:hypothetical protein
MEQTGYTKDHHPRRRETDHSEHRPVTAEDIERMLTQIRTPEPPKPSMVTLVLDRFILPAFGIVALAFIAVTAFSLIRIDQRNPAEIVVVEYETQTVEQFIPSINQTSGSYRIPLVEGFDGPAVCLDAGTVPVKSVLSTTKITDLIDIPVVGTLYWQEEPPGRSFPLEPGLPNVLPSNVTLTRNFNNPIPDAVAKAVRESESGALQFSIRGDVDVLAPGVLDATWSTEEFWLVDCERREAD